MSIKTFLCFQYFSDTSSEKKNLNGSINIVRCREAISRYQWFEKERSLNYLVDFPSQIHYHNYLFNITHDVTNNVKVVIQVNLKKTKLFIQDPILNLSFTQLLGYQPFFIVYTESLICRCPLYINNKIKQRLQWRKLSTISYTEQSSIILVRRV